MIYIVIVGIILILLIGIGILVITRKTKQKEEELPSPKENKIENREISEIGSLYQPGPCKDDYILTDGVCKKKRGDDCIGTSECQKDHICFLGTCTQKPLNWDECFSTACNEGLICIDHHIMILMSDYNKFILLPGWWIMKDCYDICDGPWQSSVYLLKEDGLYLIFLVPPARDLSLTESNNKFILICPPYIEHLSNKSQISRIVIYKDAIHALAKNGYIYRGLSNKEMRKAIENRPIEWEWDRIEFINGRDISDEIISDIVVSQPGSEAQTFALTLDDHRCLTYSNNFWTEESFSPDNLRTKLPRSPSPRTYDESIIMPPQLKYGTTRKQYITFEYDQAYYYNLEIDTKPLLLIEKVKDAIIDPSNSNCIIVIHTNGVIKKYINDNSEQITTHILKGQGEALKIASNFVWLITGTKCFHV